MSAMPEDTRRLVFMGTPEFSIPALMQLMKTEHDIVAVYTQPDKPSGRGRTPTYSPVKKTALEHGLKIVQPVRLRDQVEVDRLAALSPDLIVVVAYGQILPQNILDIPRFGCLNLHPSLLPAYRGPAPIPSAILAGDKETGVTIMLMDAGMDTGPVVSQLVVHIEPNDTAESLSERLSLTGARLLYETLDVWFEGILKPKPQDDTLATYSVQMRKEDGVINWNQPAEGIWRRIRAFYPWPGSYTWWNGKMLRILEALPIHCEEHFQVGAVLSLESDQPTTVGIQTGEGILGLITIQLEGKRPMSAGEFIRGQRKFVGSFVGGK